MLKIGLTGGIGSGKTTVAKMFQQLGTPIYLADERARQLQNQEPLRSQISELFGAEIYHEGKLNRPALAQIVFKDREKLNALNAVVHPAVQADFEHWLSQQSSPYTIKEAAIIFEIKAQAQYDAVVLVTAERATRVRRVMERDGASEEAVADRMSKQMMDEEKIPLAQHIIRNESLEATQKQVAALHKLFLSAQ